MALSYPRKEKSCRDFSLTIGKSVVSLYTDQDWCQVFARRKGVFKMKELFRAPPGFKWIFCRFRRVRNSDRILDAHDYGYEAWCFLVRA